MGDIVNCQCSTIKLSDETKSFLSKTSYDCLCKNCLTKIDNTIKLSKLYHFPVQKEMFVEGLHYYKENGDWVFTELYHLLRGYCCRSGCRHCVYGYQQQEINHKMPEKK